MNDNRGNRGGGSFIAPPPTRRGTSQESRTRLVDSSQRPRSRPTQPFTPRTNSPSSSTTHPTTMATTQRDGNMRLFEMPKQRIKAYWQFIFCVADEAYADIPTNELTVEHAKKAWCLRCNCALPMVKGKSSAGPHMKAFHAEELDAFDENERRRKAQKTAHYPTIIDAARWSDTRFTPPAAVSEQDKAVALLTEWLSTSLRPMSILEDPGFIKFVEYVNSLSTKLSMPTRHTVSNRIKRSADEGRRSLAKRIETECKFFSASADVCPAVNGGSYIILTVHFCNEAFVLESWTLEAIWVPGLHDVPSIARSLASCFTRWHLNPSYCVRVVSDGDSNMKRACEILKLKHMSCAAHSLQLVVAAAVMQKSGDMVDDSPQPAAPAADAEDPNALSVENGFHNTSFDSEPSWINARVTAIEELGGESDSDINEASTSPAREPSDDDSVTEAEIQALCSEVELFVESTAEEASEEVKPADMEAVRQTVRQFRKLAEYFRSSRKGRHRLEALQTGRSVPLKVKYDSPTHWNSTMAMLQRFGELQSTIFEFFQYSQTPQGRLELNDASTENLKLPTAEQWYTAQCLVELLAAFHAVTTFLERGSYPNFVVLQSAIRALKAILANDKIFDVVPSSARGEALDEQVLATMQSVRRSFGKLLDRQFEEATKPELLWVSLLDPYLTNSSLFTDPEHALARKNLLNEMLPIMREGAGEVENGSLENREANPTARAGASWQHLMYGSRMVLESTPPEENIRQECKAELDKYLGLSGQAKVSKNPQKPPSSLDWWKKNHSAFPTLAHLARKWLGCVATSVPSERAFSSAGNAIAKRRGSLEPDTARDIIFTAQNLTTLET